MPTKPINKGFLAYRGLFKFNRICVTLLYCLNSFRINKTLKHSDIQYHDLLCDTAESASNPDYGMIAAFWVLLDFKKAVVYHTSGDFPIKLNFFSKDEWYEILYIPLEQEYLINHVMESQSADQVKRLVVLENEGQARKVTIDNVVAFCLVDTTSGVVSYYTKK